MAAKRVAIIGAGGVGRHHAKWWHIEGADVCAFVGRSEHSNARTIAKLEELFPFAGRSYTSVAEMLEVETPDIVDVASPHACHVEHAGLAVNAGANVLCEKPLIYDPSLSTAEMLAACHNLQDLVSKSGSLFCMCAQMALGAEMIDDMWLDSTGGGEVTKLELTLKSPMTDRRERTHEEAWFDLAPHLIASLLHLFHGDITIDPRTIHVKQSDFATTTVDFDMTASAFAVETRLVTGKTVGKPQHVRRIAINEDTFEIGNSIGDDGHYCAQILGPYGDEKRPDLMRLLIRNFLAGRAVIDMNRAIRNQEILQMLGDAVARG